MTTLYQRSWPQMNETPDSLLATDEPPPFTVDNVRATRIGRIIYLSPRAAIGRLTVLENVLDVTLREGRRRTRIENLLGAAKAAIGKRNELIHGAWGITADPPIGEVHWHGLPFKDT